MTHPLMVATPMPLLPPPSILPPLVESVHHPRTADDSSDNEERDELEEDDNALPSAAASPAQSSSRQAQRSRPGSEPDNQLRVNEYEAGRVICEVCGVGVSIWDEQTGGFSVTKWKEHRSTCYRAAATTTIVLTPESTAAALVLQQNLAPNRRKRRPKRSEEQRIEFFRTDPYVAKFEPYRVLCASCNKWIRLRSNSSYCSIPWEAHRKSCLAKRNQSRVLPELRKNLLLDDPDIREIDNDRVLCNGCEIWIVVGADDDRRALVRWNEHKAVCFRSGSVSPHPSESGNAESTGSSTLERVPPPSKQQVALLSGSSTSQALDSSSSTPSLASSPDFNDVRRKNAERRAAVLRQDPLIGQVEPLRVFCTLCQKWVHLRKDTSYCWYPWSQHKAKCVRRHERMMEMDDDRRTGSSAPSSDSTILHAKRPEGGMQSFRSAQEYPKAKRVKVERFDEDYMDIDEEDNYTSDELGNPVDLESKTGRTTFICQSVEYLFRTTYSRGDEMTIALLVTYLNSALPPDKYEDFDTIEVTRVAAANPMFKNGRFVFEGDVLRIAD